MQTQRLSRTACCLRPCEAMCVWITLEREPASCERCAAALAFSPVKPTLALGFLATDATAARLLEGLCCDGG
jgi:hypothetical protein